MILINNFPNYFNERTGNKKCEITPACFIFATMVHFTITADD
jgi:hypothetical protein